MKHTILCTILPFALLTSCQDGSTFPGLQLGNQNPTNPGNGQPAPNLDLNGAWAVVEKVTAATGACQGSIGDEERYTSKITQQGGQVSLESGGTKLSGGLNGTVLNVTGSYPADGGGTITVTGSNITVTNQQLTGTINWKFTNGQDSCTGTSSLTATRQQQTGNARVESPSVPVATLIVIDDRESGIATGLQLGEELPSLLLLGRSAADTADTPVRTLGGLAPGGRLEILIPATGWDLVLRRDTGDGRRENDRELSFRPFELRAGDTLEVSVSELLR